MTKEKLPSSRLPASAPDDPGTMDHLKELLGALSRHFEGMAKANEAVAEPVTVGDNHVIPLCELSLAFGGVGGSGEMQTEVSGRDSTGIGGGVVGAAKAKPIAMLVLEGCDVRLEKLEE